MSQLQVEGIEVDAKAHVLPKTVVLYIPAREVTEKKVPLVDFYVIEIEGRKYPAAGHIINKQCLMLTLLSKKRSVRKLKEELKARDRFRIRLYPLD